jgi:hypothetical protein
LAIPVTAKVNDGVVPVIVQLARMYWSTPENCLRTPEVVVVCAANAAIAVHVELSGDVSIETVRFGVVPALRAAERVAADVAVEH